MDEKINKLAHAAALEIVHRSEAAQGDVDMIEVIIRQALRDVLAASQSGSREPANAIPKPTKKNPNRDFVSE